MGYETLLVEWGSDHVATCTINRPKALNSFNRRMMDEFKHFWGEVRERDDVHAAVLRAAPGKGFSSGADVTEGNVTAQTNVWNEIDPGMLLGPKANQCWKPVVCAVNGICAGGAFYWLNESDIVICSQDAQFFDPHVTYGLVAALEPIGMRYRAPLGEVLRMALMGNDERVGAETALRIGLVSEVTANENLWNRAAEIARVIAAKPAAATQGTVRAIWESLDTTRQAALSQAMKYCQLGNPIATAQIDRDALMRAPRKYSVR